MEGRKAGTAPHLMSKGAHTQGRAWEARPTPRGGKDVDGQKFIYDIHPLTGWVSHSPPSPQTQRANQPSKREKRLARLAFLPSFDR